MPQSVLQDQRQEHTELRALLGSQCVREGQPKEMAFELVTEGWPRVKGRNLGSKFKLMFGALYTLNSILLQNFFINTKMPSNVEENIEIQIIITQENNFFKNMTYWGMPL